MELLCLAWKLGLALAGMTMLGENLASFKSTSCQFKQKYLYLFLVAI